MITTYNQAKRLKELGFNDPTRFSVYQVNDNEDSYEEDEPTNHNEEEYFICNKQIYSAPSVSEALQWIRDKFDIKCSVITAIRTNNQFIGYEGIFLLDNNVRKSSIKNDYPEAESALLDELLTYLEQKK